MSFQQQTTNDMPNVRFYADTKEDKHASNKAGIPQFKEIEMIHISFPADRQRTVVRPAAATTKINGKSVSYMEIYQDQYKRFRAGLGPTVKGMPIKEAAFLTEANRRTLMALEVYTVEQLASLEGDRVKNLGPNGREWVEKARAFLDNAKGTVNILQQAAEIEALRKEIEFLKGVNAQAGTPAVGQPAVNAAGDKYDEMAIEDLKDRIKQHTGQPLQGNFSQARLAAMARELGV